MTAAASHNTNRSGAKTLIKTRLGYARMDTITTKNTLLRSGVFGSVIIMRKKSLESELSDEVVLMATELRNGAGLDEGTRRENSNMKKIVWSF
jgi:hypothetical protein